MGENKIKAGLEDPMEAAGRRLREQVTEHEKLIAEIHDLRWKLYAEERVVHALMSRPAGIGHIQPVSILGAANSALCLAALFAAALAWGNFAAAIAAIVTFGICYLSYACQVMFPEWKHTNYALVYLSIIAGSAGIILLVTG